MTVTIQHGNASGLLLLASGAVSSAATLDIVLTGYTAFRGLIFKLYNFVPATDNVSLYMRLSTDGGSTYDAGASAYKYFFISGGSGSATVSGNNATAAQLDIGDSIGNGAAEGANFSVELLGETSTALKSKVSWQGTIYQFNDAGVYVSGSGLRDAAQDTDAVRFLFSSGNIASGSYAVYGEL